MRWVVVALVGLLSLAPPAPVGAVIVGSADVPKSIPDDDPAGTTSTLVVETEGTVTNVRLIVNDLQHTCDADLHVALASPSGAPVTLIESFAEGGILQDLGCPEGFVSTLFDDAAPTNLRDGAAPYRGSFSLEHASVPPMPLSRLAGVPAAGTWTLLVSDRASGDTGTLYHWSLDLTVVTSSTTTTTTLPEGAGFLPSSKAIRKCEERAAKALAKLARRLLACQTRAARAALAGKTFDEPGCEAAAKAALTSTRAAGCPTCLDLPGLADSAEERLSGLRGRIYCEGTVPF